jgi:hypothetical protein
MKVFMSFTSIKTNGIALSYGDVVLTTNLCNIQRNSLGSIIMSLSPKELNQCGVFLPKKRLLKVEGKEADLKEVKIVLKMFLGYQLFLVNN